MLQDEHFLYRLPGNFFLICLFMFLFTQVQAQPVCINLRDPACQCKVIAPYNLLKNPSFESYLHCPTPVRGYSNDYDIIDFWRPGVRNSSVYLYHNDKCFEDSVQTNFALPPARPLPDGTAFILFLQNNSDTGSEKNIYKDYIAQCLQTPLKKGIAYTFSFYVGFPRERFGDRLPINPFKAGIFGHTDCSAVPFGIPYKGNGCPLNAGGWVLLGETAVAGDSLAWSQGIINLTIPYDINVIVVGPDCSKAPIYFNDRGRVVGAGLNYMDNFSLVETKDLNIPSVSIAAGDFCSGNLTLRASAKSGSRYQWYKDSFAITRATDSMYVIPANANGNYNVRVTNDNSGDCRISEPFTVKVSTLSTLQLTTDTAVCNNRLITIAPVIPGIIYNWSGAAKDSSVSVNRPGTYSITASDSNGCSKNFVVRVGTKICSNCEVLLPNAFSPNGDGINDIFKPQSNCTADEYNLQVYNRSGAIIFETKDINTGWDGSLHGKPVPLGAYYYLARYKNVTSTSGFIFKSGVVILFR